MLVLTTAGGLAWASRAATASLARRLETHSVEIGVPFPLTPAEMETLHAGRVAGVDPGAIAAERATARGKHLVEARYGCTACHGEDFGGGVMLDDPAVGRFLGPNLTRGKGGVTATFSAADWDRVVRHGVKADGTVALMPSGDNFAMTDQELSDIVHYIRTLPPVDKTVAPSSLGPIGRVLVATGQMPAAADLLPDHHAPHAVAPPATGVTVEFGAHLAAGCASCHRADFSGGPVSGGDPSWPPAGNLTPGPEGIGGWTYDDFWRAMVSGQRRDGTSLTAPMDGIAPFAAKLTDVERQAMWAYLQALPPRPDGG